MPSRLRVCEAPLGLAMGEVRVMDANAIRGCGFYLRAPEAGAYYRVTLAGMDGRVYDEEDDSGVVPVALHVEAGRPPAGPRPPRRCSRPDVRSRAAQAVRLVASAGEIQEMLEIGRANAALHREIRRQERELFARLAAEGRLETLADRSNAEPEWPAMPNPVRPCALSACTTATPSKGGAAAQFERP